MMRGQVTGRRRLTSAARRFLDAVEALANGLARQEGLSECSANAQKARAVANLGFVGAARLAIAAETLYLLGGSAVPYRDRALREARRFCRDPSQWPRQNRVWPQLWEVCTRDVVSQRAQAVAAARLREMLCDECGIQVLRERSCPNGPVAQAIRLLRAIMLTSAAAIGPNSVPLVSHAFVEYEQHMIEILARDERVRRRGAIVRGPGLVLVAPGYEIETTPTPEEDTARPGDLPRRPLGYVVAPDPEHNLNADKFGYRRGGWL